MSKLIAGHKVTLPIAGLVSSAAVGAWLGFSSCGGYVWYAYLGYAVLSLSVLAVFLGSSSLAKRGGLAILAMAVFFMARGAGFSIYVGASSPGEYLRQLGSIFSLGLC